PVDAAAYGIDANLAPVLNQLLAKSPEARYQEAEQVIGDLCAATGSPMPPEKEQIRESFLRAARFVGREQEMAHLTSLMSAAASGQGSLVLIGGESGVGKSRLVEELRTRALVEGILVLRGQAVSDGRRYYQLWRDVLRQTLLYVRPDENDLPLFQLVVPDLARLLNQAVPGVSQESLQTHQQQLSHAVIRLLSRLARPAMIVLEDLQWAGTESIALLQELASGLADQPVLLAGTFRDDRPGSLHEQLQTAEYMHLNRLTGEDIASLSESMLGRAGRDPVVIELLQRETEGNAFFLVETVRALAEGAGQLDKINVTRPPQFIMPRGMQAILQRRLSRVPKDARPLMQLASVAGRVLDLALLRAMEPGADFDSWLLTCTDASVLEAYGETWRFSHDKLREAIKDSLSHELHHALHRRVAEGIEAIYPDAPEYAAALAHHWLVAGDRKKELHYTTIAADQAAKSNAQEEAIALFERALEVLLLQAETPERDRQELTLQMGLGTQLMASRGFHAPEVIRVYARARELAIRTDQIDSLFRATWGQSEFYIHSQLYDLETAEELLEQLFDLADQSENDHLLLEAHHAGWTTAYARGDAAAIEKQVRLGLELYDRQTHQEHRQIYGHDPAVCAYVSGAIGYWLLGYPDRALQSVEEGLALAEALGHPFTTAVSKWGATIIACLRGEILLAFEAAKDFATHSQEHGFSLYARVSGILQEIAESQSMGPRERKILAHKVYETASTNKGWPLWPWTFSQYLEACLAAGTARDGLQAVQRELDESPLAGQRLFISEVRRLYGELLLAEDEDLVPEAKEQFDLARAIARRQSARSLDLRVTMSLARLRRRQGRQMDAYRLLAESYSWFSEGFDTADLRAARKLLEELSEEST
ncbi:MAG: AAA family ATPase, partial [Chloroflexota bacterium]